MIEGYILEIEKDLAIAKLEDYFLDKCGDIPVAIEALSRVIRGAKEAIEHLQYEYNKEL